MLRIDLSLREMVADLDTWRTAILIARNGADTSFEVALRADGHAPSSIRAAISRPSFIPHRVSPRAVASGYGWKRGLRTVMS
jgi:hypothetical protein